MPGTPDEVHDFQQVLSQVRTWMIALHEIDDDPTEFAEDHADRSLRASFRDDQQDTRDLNRTRERVSSLDTLITENLPKVALAAVQVLTPEAMRTFLISSMSQPGAPEKARLDDVTPRQLAAYLVTRVGENRENLVPGLPPESTRFDERALLVMSELYLRYEYPYQTALKVFDNDSVGSREAPVRERDLGEEVSLGREAQNERNQEREYQLGQQRDHERESTRYRDQAIERQVQQGWDLGISR